jgi:hypothetical protein
MTSTPVETNPEINCAVECVNGCKLGENCPNQAYQAGTAQFIEETSLDAILAMAEVAVRKRQLERASTPTQWVIPDDF